MTRAGRPSSAPGEPFGGAKVALLHDGQVLCYLRDDHDGLPFRGMWDLPGGGREGDESPETCALRELAEEFGLHLGPERLLWWCRYEVAGRVSFFFGGRLFAEEIAAIRFGDEGQFWRMMPTGEFAAHPDAVPVLQERLARMLAETGTIFGPTA